MWNRRAALVWFLALTFAAAVAVAQNPEAEYVTESRLLESDLDRYVEARERERRAITELREVAKLLDDTLADPNAPVSELRELESRFTAAREATVRRLEDSSQARLRMYDRMDRLFGLASDLERGQPDPVDQADEGADGLWQFRFQGAGISALVDMEFAPSGLDRNFQVTGSYRTSNGHTGDLRGNFFGTRLSLEAIDSRMGKVAVLDGTVGAEGRLEGTWQAVETGLRREDRQRGGLWSGHRVSASSEIELD